MHTLNPESHITGNIITNHGSYTSPSEPFLLMSLYTSNTTVIIIIVITIIIVIIIITIMISSSNLPYTHISYIGQIQVGLGHTLALLLMFLK